MHCDKTLIPNNIFEVIDHIVLLRRRNDIHIHSAIFIDDQYFIDLFHH